MFLNKTQRIFFGIVSFRLISWFLVRTYFIADEYWQTFEIAHRLAFGYGYQTWEWRSNIAIRSYFYPSVISLIYRFLAFFRLDSVSMLISSATLFQTFLTIIGDLAFWKFLQGHRLIYLILLCRYTCWYTMYSSPRLIVNNLEEILFICSLAAAKKSVDDFERFIVSMLFHDLDFDHHHRTFRFIFLFRYRLFFVQHRPFRLLLFIRIFSTKIRIVFVFLSKQRFVLLF